MARNAEAHLSSTLDSLLQQTLQPERVIVVDDGSNDGTRRVLERYSNKYPTRVKAIELPDRGYDIRRVPNNINVAWQTATASGLSTEFFMISGDDCTYPSRYVERLLMRMSGDRAIVVASGHPSTGVDIPREHSPSGSGRVIRCSFWIEAGEEYPFRAGWETWLLYEALMRKLRVVLFSDVTFEHIRPRGAKHQLFYWGAAMYSLGYHPLYAVGRIGKNVVTRSIALKGGLNLVRGYLIARLGSSDPFISQYEPSLRCFVSRDQAASIARVVRKVI